MIADVLTRLNEHVKKRKRYTVPKDAQTETAQTQGLRALAQNEPLYACSRAHHHASAQATRTPPTIRSHSKATFSVTEHCEPQRESQSTHIWAMFILIGNFQCNRYVLNVARTTKLATANTSAAPSWINLHARPSYFG